MTNPDKIVNKKLVTTQTIFTITLIVSALTVLSIWLFGLGQNKTIFENSILSTSILSVTFSLFLTVGLYNGIKLKDNIGKITDKITISNLPDFSGLGQGTDFIQVGDGIEGVIFSVVLWVVATILFSIFILLFGAVLWTGILVFMAMLYWIFFRALRLVFKNSNQCKGNLSKSVLFGLGYTTLYNFWIYVIILVAHYLTK